MDYPGGFRAASAPEEDAEKVYLCVMGYCSCPAGLSTFFRKCIQPDTECGDCQPRGGPL